MAFKSNSRSSAISSFIRSPGLSTRERKRRLHLFSEKKKLKRPWRSIKVTGDGHISLVVCSNSVSILCRFRDSTSNNAPEICVMLHSRSLKMASILSYQSAIVFHMWSHSSQTGNAILSGQYTLNLRYRFVYSHNFRVSWRWLRALYSGMVLQNAKSR